jgi:hypothetical protein
VYNNQEDILESSFIIADSPDEGDSYISGIIFPNNYIVTIQVAAKSYYILSNIDYDSRKFIELKKIEIDDEQSDYEIMNNVFNVLNISKSGELLDDSHIDSLLQK